MISVTDITERVKERFWAKVEKTDDGCWLWSGALRRSALGFDLTRKQT